MRVFKLHLQITFFLLAHLRIAAQEFCEKRKIQTASTIECSAEKIWNFLLDTANYKSWHPYISRIQGELKEGAKITVYTCDSSGETGKFKAYILRKQSNQNLTWGGNIKPFFSAQHYFQISVSGKNTCIFTQGESWGGWFGGWYGKRIYKKTYQKFVLMNARMKSMLEPHTD